MANMKNKIELADILKANIHKINCAKYEKNILNAIINCRTDKLGGHKSKCDQCGNLEISYNSCRNRHCPKCQGANGFKWVDKKMEDILPKRFVKIRYGGFLANCIRKKRIIIIKNILKNKCVIMEVNRALFCQAQIGKNLCPQCQKGQMIVFELIKSG
jgi:hypothetical protein